MSEDGVKKDAKSCDTQSAGQLELDIDVEVITPEEVDGRTEVEAEVVEPQVPQLPLGAMAVGDSRFGITATGEPIGHSHWLCDSSLHGDLIAALPSTVLVAGKTAEAGGVAVDMCRFIDSVIEGAGRLEGIQGIVEASGHPAWAVNRVMGTFPVLMSAYEDGIDKTILTVEAAAIKAAIGMKQVQTRRRMKITKDEQGRTTGSESATDTIEKDMMPDPALAKHLLTNRMKHRYKDDGGVQQAVQINIIGPEANL